jgi:retinol dehydrogenase-12
MVGRMDKPQSLLGRVAIVTGANTGIGRATAFELANRGAQVLLACRSADKTAPVVEEIARQTGNPRVELVALDLGDLDSVRKCASEFLARGLPLHLLINNAGLGGHRGLTRSGFELAFGVNHIGHFLLTNLLLERLAASAPARVVTVASGSHYRARTIDFEAVRKRTASRNGMAEYGVSKLANVLFSAELARRLHAQGIHEVTTYSLHPGVVATDIWRAGPRLLRAILKLVLLTPEQGAKTTLYCATAPELATQTGLYYDKCKVKAPSRVAGDRALAEELWTRSEAWTR